MHVSSSGPDAALWVATAAGRAVSSRVRWDDTWARLVASVLARRLHSPAAVGCNLSAAPCVLPS